MARFKRQKIIILYCPSCTLPMPFEDYDGAGIFIGKCAICGSEYQAHHKVKDPIRFEVRLKNKNL